MGMEYKRHLDGRGSLRRQLSGISATFEANLWRLRFLLYLFTVYIAVVMYAVCKLIGIAACDQSIWSVSGCVDLDGYASSMASPHVRHVVTAVGLGCLLGLAATLVLCWLGYCFVFGRARTR